MSALKSTTPRRNTGKKLGNATSFKSGAEWRGNSAGRPKGSRNKLTAEFIAAMSDDFEANGAAVIAKVRTEKPEAYLKLVASLVPQRVEVDEAELFTDWTEEELEEFMRSATERLKAMDDAMRQH